MSSCTPVVPLRGALGHPGGDTATVSHKDGHSAVRSLGVPSWGLKPPVAYGRQDREGASALGDKGRTQVRFSRLSRPRSPDKSCIFQRLPRADWSWRWGPGSACFQLLISPRRRAARRRRLQGLPHRASSPPSPRRPPATSGPPSPPGSPGTQAGVSTRAPPWAPALRTRRPSTPGHTVQQGCPLHHPPPWPLPTGLPQAVPAPSPAPLSTRRLLSPLPASAPTCPNAAGGTGST